MCNKLLVTVQLAHKWLVRNKTCPDMMFEKTSQFPKNYGIKHKMWLGLVLD